jgi:hypothetical protein
MRVCETCKYKSTPPPELLGLLEELSKLYPRVFYCGKLQEVKVYDPGSPTKLFDCKLYESEQQ